MKDNGDQASDVVINIVGRSESSIINVLLTVNLSLINAEYSKFAREHYIVTLFGHLFLLK